MNSHEGGLPSVARLNEVMDAGNRALRGQRWKEALEFFESAAALKPQYIGAWLGKAIALRGLDDTRGAIAAYRNALEIDASDRDVWTGLIETLHEARMFKEEAEACESLLRISPRVDEVLLNKGVALHALGKLEKALDCFDQLVARRPENVAALNNKGAVLLRLGRFDEALEAFDTALAHEPQREDVQRNRCLVLMKLGRYSEAVRAADEMLAVREEGWLWMLKGLAHAELKEMPLALESLERAQQLSPTIEGIGDAVERVRRLHRVMTAQKESATEERESELEVGTETAKDVSPMKPQGMAVILDHLGFPTEALRIWQGTIDKDKPDDWLGLARSLYAGGEQQAAERCLREASNRGGGRIASTIAASLDAESSSAQSALSESGVDNELGQCWRETAALVKRGQQSSAINQLAKLLETRNDLERSWNWLGVLNAMSGHHVDAREALRKAADANTNYATAWNNLGAVFAADDNLDEANLALKMALGVNPRHVEALHNLGLVEFRRGNLEEARRLLGQAAKAKDHHQTWLALATVTERMNLWREAARCYRKSIELGCKSRGAMDGLARVRGQLGALKKSKIEKSARRLEQMPGIGPQRARTLAKAGFVSLASVKSADIDELAALPGLNRSIAKSLKRAVLAQKRRKGTSTRASRR